MTLAEIFRRHGPAFLAGRALSSGLAKVWRAIVACRTALLGGHVETCDCCGVIRHVYHSCRNRHCPQCQTRAKEDWLAKRRQELLPVPYFHLVFTLPHALNGLIGQRPRAMYELLFAVASATLTDFAANPRWLGGTPAFSLVLHTWKQDLGRHVHVHALVAGGALTAEGEWKSPRRGFLFPVKAERPSIEPDACRNPRRPRSCRADADRGRGVDLLQRPHLAELGGAAGRDRASPDAAGRLAAVSVQAARWPFHRGVRRLVGISWGRSRSRYRGRGLASRR